MRKAIHINAEAKTISICEIQSLEDMQALVGGYIEPVHYTKGLGQAQLYVNEEGLYKDYKYGFSIDGYGFVGNGFITCGVKDVDVSVQDITPRVVWLGEKEEPVL